jgi:hypothetical protein
MNLAFCSLRARRPAQKTMGNSGKREQAVVSRIHEFPIGSGHRRSRLHAEGGVEIMRRRNRAARPGV